MKIKKKNVRFIYDTNHYKQNRYIPNTRIKIKDPKEIKKDKPEFLIIFPWNLKDEIKEKLRYTKKWGCKFLTINPYLKIIT